MVSAVKLMTWSRTVALSQGLDESVGKRPEIPDWVQPSTAFDQQEEPAYVGMGG